eukprot:NODE_25_length_41203_cov_0.917113.p12 type:complete len:331 gc:universal NODE_25_length_41203_cov_0.917113:18150-17158(-)
MTLLQRSCKMVSNVIIGSGITGSIIANKLKESEIESIVLEQTEHGHGRTETNEADTGAQFFTVRTDEFGKLVQEWKSQNLVKVWSEGFPPKNDNYPRYCAVDGMGNLVDDLCENLKIKYKTQVNTIEESENEFILHTNKGIMKADHVVLTAPLPKSLKLVEDIIPKADFEKLAEVKYWPCVTLIMELDDKFKIGENGAYQHKGSVIDFVANNHTKGITDKEIITIHCGKEFSEAYFKKSDRDIIDKVNSEWKSIEALSDLSLSKAKVLRWDYSQPKNTFKKSTYHYSNGPKTLILAGDGFGDSKIEGACLSALHAAEELRHDFNDALNLK